MKNLHALFFLLALSACVHQKPVAVEDSSSKTVTWDLVTKEQAVRSGALSSILGKMSVEFEGHDDSVRGLGTSAAILPNDYLLEIRDPVGRLHFQAVARGNAFEGYFPRHKKIYKDQGSGRPFFQKTWGIPISFPEMSRLSAGLLPKALEKQKPSALSWKDGVYEGKFEVDGASTVVGLNSEGALTRLNWQRKEGDVEVSWRDFRPCCKWTSVNANSFAIAHVIEIKTKDSIILIRWKSFQNWELVPNDAFKVQTAAGTKVIPLD